jgi:hypothetical protein
MTIQISQRGKQYLQTARTLLRAAQTMTDEVIARQLQLLAEDYERRAEKASHVDAAKALARAADASAGVVGGCHQTVSSEEIWAESFDLTRNSSASA